MRRNSSGGSGLVTRSFSKSSMPSKPAAEIASSFSSREPERHTVAIDVLMSAAFPDTGGAIGGGSTVGQVAEEVVPHPMEVRLQPGDEAEAVPRLPDRHPSTVERAVPSRLGSLQ